MMDDLRLDDAVVSGELDKHAWVDIKLANPSDGRFCICEHEATMLIIHLATVFDIDLKFLKKDNEI